MSRFAPFFLCLILVTCAACGSRSKPMPLHEAVSPLIGLDEAAVQRYFDAYGVEGTLVLIDDFRNRTFRYNEARAGKPYLPASTFKVFHALVALETGVVSSPDEVFRWDGVDRGWERWNQDLTFRDAFRYSAVWVFQEVARRIGAERMHDYLERAGYGNRDMSGGLDVFWLEGGLRTTASEQAVFITRLYLNDLPFSRRTMDRVKDMMILEQNETYVWRGKTGWAQRDSTDVGWFVGYLERDGSAYAFALNLDIAEDEDAEARMGITRAVLQDLGLFSADVQESE